MVLKHNKRPSDNVESCEHVYKHARQLECGDQLASFAEISSFRVSAQDSPVSESKDTLGHSRGEESLGADDNCLFSVIEEDFEVTKNDHNVTGHSGHSAATCEVSSLSWNTSCYGEVVRSEHQKWLSSDDESYRPADKLPSRLNHNYQQSYFTEIQPISSGNCEELPTSAVADEELENNRASSFHKDSPRNACHFTLGLPYVTCGPNKVRTSSFPAYFEDELQMAGTNHVEDFYSQFYDFPHRKLVAVGPNHQADIPAWKSQDSENFSCKAEKSVGSNLASASVYFPFDEDDSEKCVGACIMPMPGCGLHASELEIRGRTPCKCTDEGSIRCVRQHVMEAREKLKQTLGQATFMELGFGDMGEDVAQNWSEEEEQAFHEVVLSYPASLGKNFWNYLHEVFPSRSSKELVSYYFNVFMLRKRAEQNRLDPSNADSDNDEWQVSDDGDSEEEDDSVVDSPTYGDNGTYNDDGQMGDMHRGSEDADPCDDCAAEVYEKEGLCDASEQYISNGAKNVLENGEDHDCQDDSCSSFEGQLNVPQSYGGPADKLEVQYGFVKEHKDLDREYKANGGRGLNLHVYDMSHCDPRTWNVGHFCGPDRDIEFLPTCDVIEEVCGKGTWEEAVNGHGVS